MQSDAARKVADSVTLAKPGWGTRKTQKRAAQFAAERPVLFERTKGGSFLSSVFGFLAPKARLLHAMLVPGDEFAFLLFLDFGTAVDG